MLPPPFVQQMKNLLGAEAADLALALQQPAPTSIRRHRHKWQPQHHAPVGETAVPWHPLGRYWAERPVFTLDPLFQAGAYYVQEASSMFLGEALRQSVDFSKSLKIMDLCAAPGGKSTLIADLIGPDSLLVANEVIRSRVSALRENIEKWGYANGAVVSAEAEAFAGLEGFFDVIVTDAPCSGEGMFRKDPDAIREWSLDHVQLCAARQRRILAAAVAALAPEGVLVYSTCTFNAAENEDNVAWLAAEFDLAPVPLSVPAEWNIVGGASGYHFYPHRVRGEGFFIAVFRKKGGIVKKNNAAAQFQHLKALPKAQVPDVMHWLRPDAEVSLFLTPNQEIQALPTALLPTYLVLDKVLKSKWFGTTVGEVKGKDMVPHHALSQSLLRSPELPIWDLERRQALLFLKREAFEVPDNTPKGWALAAHQGLPLGWLKLLPNRMNNYFPPERRIRMDIG